MRQAYDYWQDQPGFYQPASPATRYRSRRPECGWVSASSGENRELTTPTRGPASHLWSRPLFTRRNGTSGRDSQDELRPKHRRFRSTDPVKDSRASTPATVGDVPPDTHTSSLSMARAGHADDGHDETPRTRRPARHDRTRTAPRPRGKRQWNAESRAHGLSPHSARTQPVRGLPRSGRPAAAARRHSPTLPNPSPHSPAHPGAALRNPENAPRFDSLK